MKTLLGFPVIESEAMPKDTIVFGDMSAYLRPIVASVEVNGDEMIITFKGQPAVGDMFRVTIGGKEISLIVTAQSADGKTFSAGRLTP